MENIIVTGAAGFIGYNLTEKLVAKGYNILGLDNLQDCPEGHLKFERLGQLGFCREDIIYGHTIKSGHCSFIKSDITDISLIDRIFKENPCDILIHLAAQTGVRQSVSQPDIYMKNNINGFYNILETCRKYNIKKILFASSSSVYGENPDMPYREDFITDNPVSMYAVTKKTNELMAKAYSSLYGFNNIGLRFFTVYGPWVRSDMAAYIFMKAVLENNTINLYNNGFSLRDFTYIDDVTRSIELIMEKMIQDDSRVPLYELYNVGNSMPVTLVDYLNCIKKHMGKNTTIINKPLQEGDVTATYANVDKIFDFIGFKPQTNIDTGVKKMVDWFLNMKK
ncbi:MAG: NAD-dependent epimerase/dehydratase family protein [Bacteroidales bacterium]|nr:NAD-dependent epimerase/dehydratase family protein [Bacteroidales bacterium]